jgi:DNA helicase-2/ATP-dependent DNA helicase PcrA
VPLDPEQRQAVLAPLGPVCILAGAGTGKTRTITHRIEHITQSSGVAGSQVLAVTFTTRAAGELRGRLRTLGVDGVQARTFHAAALKQLSYFWPKVAGVALPKLVESKISLVARAASRMHIRPDRTELRDLTSEVEWAKATLVTPEGYPAAAAGAGRETTHPSELIAALYAAYEEVKRSAGVLDFDDLLLLTAAIIEEHRWVATEVHSRYRHFLVDEYQDVNPLQQRVLEAWLGDRDSLCVVGDANQTIYSFNGATPRFLLEFPRRFPTATLVRLVRDYRSTPQVVGLANALLARGDGESLGIARGAAGSLVAQLPDGPQPRFVVADHEPEEATLVARRIAELTQSGVSASEIAVLYRINAQSEAYETALSEAGISYILHGGQRFFERPEVLDAVRLLRAAARSADTDAPLGLGDLVADVFGAVGWRPNDPPAGSGAERERWENLAALWRLAVAAEQAALAADPADLAQAVESGQAGVAGSGEAGSGEAGSGEAGSGETDGELKPAATLESFLADLADRAAHQHSPTVQGVTLASLHAAKGLEWDAVFLVGLVEGTLPIVHAKTPAQVAEERRLLYVGITRARQHLTLSWALARAEGGRRARRPSRFVDDIRPTSPARAASGGRRAAGEATSGSGAGGRNRNRNAVRCRVCGKTLAGAQARFGRCDGCPGNVDAALFERLRVWRAARAKEQGAPAFVVFTDATLVAIAEQRPTTVAALVAVPGIGQAKLDRYGEDVLALVQGREAEGAKGAGSDVKSDAGS